MIEKEISLTELLREDTRRMDKMKAPFNPLTGEGSVGARVHIYVEGLTPEHQWIPEEMMEIPMVKHLVSSGSLREFLRFTGAGDEEGEDSLEGARDWWVRLRCRYDFPFWAALLVYVKNKDPEGEPEVLFRLTWPQRKFVAALEEFRLASKPIRLVLLKARQWGGSTTSQLYMAWLQLTRRQGLNSLIIAHQGTASDEIKGMFDRMIKAYPVEMLVHPGESYSPGEAKMTRVGRSGAIFRIPRRKCNIKIGTAESPDSSRGGDYALVHLSEVGIWKNTDGKSPGDIVRAACAGVPYKPGTMIVYESTANGHGNFFHHEYMDARDNPRSQFRALFVAWYDIPWNILPFGDEEDRRRFAASLLKGRRQKSAASTREEPGAYLWWLWEKGATLEAIHWYIAERGKYTSHGQIAAECPSDDTEAFVNSGAAVFDKYIVEGMRRHCRHPLATGDLSSPAEYKRGKKPRFIAEENGMLKIWSYPDGLRPGEDGYVRHRYLVTVDIGGRGSRADWSVIAVMDRLPLLSGEPPEIVAQWRGHIDIDLLAWKALDVALYYEEALLVIESNTLETHDRERQIEGGDQSAYILNQLGEVYGNLYTRSAPAEDIREGRPVKYGFHTNTATKPMIITGLIKYVREGAWIERESIALDELLDYERKPNGAYGAIAGSHDDVLMTRAIGLHVCFNEMPLPTITEEGGHARRERPETLTSTAIF